MKRGTVVLTKFPFTDLTSTKRRPAIVVFKTESQKEDVIVAFISSVIPEIICKTDYILGMNHKDFKKSGLKTTSVIKLDKLATLNKSIFSGELGVVSKDTLLELNGKLMIALDLI